MKIKFCDYIKKAKVGNVFYAVETGDYYKITKIMKESTFATERLHCGAKESEEIEWYNNDTCKIIY